MASHGNAQVIDVYVGSDVQELDPHQATSFAEHAVAGALHRTLVAYDSAGQIIPDLAESWSVDRARTRWVFTLKPGLTWSDGRPLTSEDFVAGLQRALISEQPSPFVNQLQAIARRAPEAGEGGTQALQVFAPDPLSVELNLVRPDDLLPYRLTWPLAAPVPAANPDAIASGQVVSGDYVVSGTPTDSLVLFHRGTGQQLRVQPTLSVSDAWERSSVSEAFVSVALPIVSVPRPGDRGDDVRTSGSQDLYGYVVNTRRSPLNTLEARHALAMAINRAEVLADVSVPGATPAVEFVPSTAKTYETSYRTPYASLTEEEREAVAEALLADAGFGSDNRFAVRLRIPSGDIHRTVADAVARQWQRSGIVTEIICAPMPEHWAALEAGDFGVAFASWPGPKDTPRSFIEPLSTFSGPWNFGAYTFDELGERLSRAAEASRPDVRAQYYREAEKALIEDQTVFALFTYSPLSLVSPNLVGWQTNAAGVHPLAQLGVRPDVTRPIIKPPELPRAVPSIGQGR